MDCDRLRASLYAYLDGELDVKDTIEVEQHIGLCPMCEALVRYEERFRKTVRTMLVREPAPASLRERIAKSLDEYQESRFSWASWFSAPAFRYGAVAAAATVLVVAAVVFAPYLIPKPPRAQAREILDDAIKTQLKYMKNELPPEYRCRDVAELAGWFLERLEFVVEPPFINAEPVGGRLYQLRGFEVACFFYRCPKNADKQFSIFACDADCIEMPRRMDSSRYLSHSAKGLSAVMWVNNGVAYITVGNTDREHLLARLSPSNPGTRLPSSRDEDSPIRNVKSVIVEQ